MVTGHVLSACRRNIALLILNVCVTSKDVNDPQKFSLRLQSFIESKAHVHPFLSSNFGALHLPLKIPVSRKHSLSKFSLLIAKRADAAEKMIVRGLRLINLKT